MKNNDCLFSDIQNLCKAVSDWLIQKINNPIETRKTGKHLMIGKRRKTPENTKILQENTKIKFIYSIMV